MNLQSTILIAVTMTAALTDVSRGKVYNWLTYPAALLGLSLSFFSAPPSPPASLLGLGLGLALFGALRGIGKMGAGDVKLMAAIGALKGPVFLLFASFYVIVAAGLAAIVVLAVKRRLIPTLRWAASVMAASVMPGMSVRQIPATSTDMPFAPAICVGTVYAVLLEIYKGPFSF